MRVCTLLVILAMAASPVMGADLGTMILGSDAVGLRDLVQLTRLSAGRIMGCGLSPDGKTVACVSAKYDKASLELVGVDDGKVTALLTGVAGPGDITDDAIKKAGSLWRLGDSRINWSPDGNHFVLVATKVRMDGDRRIEQEVVLVMDSSGKQKAAFSLGDDYVSSFAPLFSPDGKKIAEGEASQKVAAFRIGVYDLDSGKSSYFMAQDYTELARWSKDGGAVQYWSDATPKGKTGMDLREINLSDGSDKVIGAPGGNRGSLSPDGKTVAVPDDKGLTLVKQESGESRLVVKGPRPGVGSWAPNGEMVIFTLPSKVADPDGLRSADLRQLWLAGTEKHKFNTVLVSLDFDSSVRPTWSADSSKVAYVSRGLLYVAEFSRKPARPDQKVEAGVPFTDADAKAVVTVNAERIRQAFSDYLVERQMLPLMLDELYEDSVKDAFVKPGSGEVIFKYEAKPGLPITQVGNDTLLGTLDAGLGWKIVIYLGKPAVVQ